MQAINKRYWSSCVWLSLPRQERQYQENLNDRSPGYYFFGKKIRMQGSPLQHVRKHPQLGTWGYVGVSGSGLQLRLGDMLCKALLLKLCSRHHPLERQLVALTYRIRTPEIGPRRFNRLSRQFSGWLKNKSFRSHARCMLGYRTCYRYTGEGDQVPSSQQRGNHLGAGSKAETTSPSSTESGSAL